MNKRIYFFNCAVVATIVSTLQLCAMQKSAMVRVQTSDGSVEISRAALEQSEMFKHMLEDIPYDSSAQLVVPLENFSTQQVALLATYLEHEVQDEKGRSELGKDRNISDMNLQQLTTCVQLADFLHVPAVQKLCAQAVIRKLLQRIEETELTNYFDTDLLNLLDSLPDIVKLNVAHAMFALDKNVSSFLGHCCVEFYHRFAQFGSTDTCLVAWSPDGKIIAVAYFRQVVWVDASSGQRLHTYQTPLAIRLIKWSPDSTALAIVGVHCSQQYALLHIFNLKNNNVLKFVHVPYWVEPAEINWSPDGTKLVLGYTNAPPIVVDVQEHIEYNNFYSNYAPTTCVDGVQWLDNTTLVNTSGIFVARYTYTGECLNSFRVNHSAGGVLAPDGSKLLLDVGTTRYIIDTQTGQQVCTLTGLDDGSLHHESWSPCGKKIAGFTKEQVLALWDATTGKQLQCMHALMKNQLYAGLVANYKAGYYEAPLWSPNASMIMLKHGKILFVVDVATETIAYGPLWTQGSAGWSPCGEKIVDVNQLTARVHLTPHAFINKFSLQHILVVFVLDAAYKQRQYAHVLRKLYAHPELAPYLATLPEIFKTKYGILSSDTLS